ncbi:hypothetical protein [Empedobacter falsenii]|uniref:hypothetical protein n=1 Tax=Empedobacter falsenii TaxID=343874 RepID=UPI003A80076B
MDQEKLKKAIVILDDAKEKVGELLKEDPSFSLQTQSVLGRMVASMKHSAGIVVIESGANNNSAPRKLRAVFGTPVNVQNNIQRIKELPSEKTEHAQQVANLRKEASILISKLELKSDYKQIKNDYDELVIFGAAKLVGLEFEQGKTKQTKAWLESLFAKAVAYKEKQLAQQEIKEDLTLKDKVEFIVTESYLTTHPELIQLGVKAGDKIMIDKDEFELLSEEPTDLSKGPGEPDNSTPFVPIEDEDKSTDSKEEKVEETKNDKAKSK